LPNAYQTGSSLDLHHFALGLDTTEQETQIRKESKMEQNNPSVIINLYFTNDSSIPTTALSSYFCKLA
jgi:hypothetical protein